MCQFVESIKYLNGEYYNLEYHQKRFENTRAVFYPDNNRILLSNILSSPDGLIKDQVYKCRVLYGKNVTNIIYEPYIRRIINRYSLIVCPDEFDYSHKYTERSIFEKYTKNLKTDEDYIYVKHGLITDTTYANLVFSGGNKYYTPASTLLKGTKRAYYLRKRIIQELEMKVADIQNFKTFTIINAMIDLGSAPDFCCDKLLLSHNQMKI